MVMHIEKGQNLRKWGSVLSLTDCAPKFCELVTQVKNFFFFVCFFTKIIELSACDRYNICL